MDLLFLRGSRARFLYRRLDTYEYLNPLILNEKRKILKKIISKSFHFVKKIIKWHEKILHTYLKTFGTSQHEFSFQVDRYSAALGRWKLCT